MPSLTTPVPFREAVDRFDGRTPVASAMRTAEWESVPGAIRDRAFFSAGVEEARILSEMRDRIASDLSLDPQARHQGKDAFVAEMRKSLGAAAGDSGRLTDLTSFSRLRLIYDMNVQEAQEFGRHKASQSEAIRSAFPARELIRVEAREDTRPWQQRWTANGGRIYGGRMIAPVNDPIWAAISRFGRPYPPFDYNSGMGIATIGRDEAERLGVIRPGETPPAEDPPFNGQVEASVRGVGPGILDRLRSALGSRITIEAGKAILSE